MGKHGETGIKEYFLGARPGAPKIRLLVGAIGGLQAPQKSIVQYRFFELKNCSAGASLGPPPFGAQKKKDNINRRGLGGRSRRVQVDRSALVAMYLPLCVALMLSAFTDHRPTKQPTNKRKSSNNKYQNTANNNNNNHTNDNTTNIDTNNISTTNDTNTSFDTKTSAAPLPPAATTATTATTPPCIHASMLLLLLVVVVLLLLLLLLLRLHPSIHLHLSTSAKAFTYARKRHSSPVTTGAKQAYSQRTSLHPSRQLTQYAQQTLWSKKKKS